MDITATVWTLLPPIIAIALARAHADWHVAASDISPDALALAGENGRTDVDSIRQCYYLIAKKERRPVPLKLPTPALNYNPSLSVYDGLMGGDEHV